MTRPAPFTTADVQRALKAAKGAGLHVISYEIDRDGTIRVLTGEPQTEQPDLSPVERWRQRRGRSAA